MAKYQKRIHEWLEQMKEEEIEVKVFIVLRKENHEANLMTKLVASRTMEMLRDDIIQTTEVSCIKEMLICTIEERKD